MIRAQQWLLIFTARRYASAVYAVVTYPVSGCLPQLGVLSVVTNSSIYIFKQFTKYCSTVQYTQTLVVLVFKHFQGVFKYLKIFKYKPRLVMAKQPSCIKHFLQLRHIVTVQFT